MPVGRQREQLRAVPDHRRAVGEREERPERLVDVALGRVGRVVVELGVGQDGDPGRELEQRAVGLVGLDDQPLPRAPAGVGPRRADGAADEVARVHPAAAQRVHEHARRRRLAVRAGDRDRRAQPGELAEQVGAVQLAQAALARSGALGVVGRDRAGDHDLGAVGHVGAVVADRRLDADRAQRAGVGGAGGAVRARDARSERVGDEREPAHPGAADPDEVQLASSPLGAHGGQPSGAVPRLSRRGPRGSPGAVALAEAAIRDRARARHGAVVVPDQRELRARMRGLGDLEAVGPCRRSRRSALASFTARSIFTRSARVAS